MSWWHVICCQFLANIGNTQILWLNELHEWHVTSFPVSSTTLLGDVVYHLLLLRAVTWQKRMLTWRHIHHVGDMSQNVTLLPSVSLWQQTTIRTKSLSVVPPLLLRNNVSRCIISPQIVCFWLCIKQCCHFTISPLQSAFDISPCEICQWPPEAWCLMVQGISSHNISPQKAPLCTWNHWKICWSLNWILQ